MLLREFPQLTYSFDRQVIDGISNEIGIMNFVVEESIKYLGGDRS